jgi:DNA-binding transcriptional LysR family regulator
VKLAVSRGYGVAGCSRFAVDGELRAGSLALVRLRGWNVRRTISIIRLRDAASTPAARELVTMLHARWGRKPPGPARRPRA